jgi:hypothetical protein
MPENFSTRGRTAARLLALGGTAVAAATLTIPAATTADAAPAVGRVSASVAAHESHALHGPKSNGRGGNDAVASGNWSGYASTGASGADTSVSSSWVQPSVTCTAQDTYSSFWVGLDGYNDSALEQTGTEADCINEQAQYGAW